ncbi:uncharacterized protein PHALS_11558 [Plasmopara halstedii]|uniref:Uncharacterized protein n=1 Tax=Plasmopara halstedii TaxID=4781 RepID=A0A0N7L5D8_PLAHL|nr:uncharacterized protein PHALS_11558 [Plasmopara halstedii]CEG41195.1 hypothetical protein PHALS_11558 [Plasmopara halstedii]|eukprot:XP_024577564.1 hypothetical protein PHALS_11558 [Plasmopara halstedii]
MTRQFLPEVRHVVDTAMNHVPDALSKPHQCKEWLISPDLAQRRIAIASLRARLAQLLGMVKTLNILGMATIHAFE